jgi:hypothetical protein
MGCGVRHQYAVGGILRSNSSLGLGSILFLSLCSRHRYLAAESKLLAAGIPAGVIRFSGQEGGLGEMRKDVRNPTLT